MIRPYYQDANVTIYNANCADVFGQLPPIDLTVTSPPYDNLRKYNGYTFDFEAIAQGLWRVTKPGGVVVWVVGDATIDGSETGTSFRQALRFKEIGFSLHDTMIYSKEGAPQSHNRYEQKFEFMFVFSRDEPVVFHGLREESLFPGKKRCGGMRQDGDTLSYRNTGGRVSDTKLKGNVWTFAVNPAGSAIDPSVRKHPAVFPEALASDHIRSWSNRGDTILDPMCGSGTTLKMARKNGCKAIGIDISEEYCELSANRLRQEVFDFAATGD